MLYAILACAAWQPVTGREVTPAPKSYADAHRAWTEEVRLYDGFETALIVRATLRTEDLRRAAAREQAYRAAMSDDEYQALLVRELATLGTSHELFFTVMPGERETRTLGGDPESPWRLRLFVDGRPCALEDLERQARPDLLQRELVLQLNPWSDLWTARFSADCGQNGEMAFVISGPQASGELRWDLPATR